MAEINQYTISLREVAEATIRKNGITAGKWVIGVNFGLQVGNLGRDPEQKSIRPGVAVIIDGLTLSRFPDGQEVPVEMQSVVVDASSVAHETPAKEGPKRAGRGRRTKNLT